MWLAEPEKAGCRAILRGRQMLGLQRSLSVNGEENREKHFLNY